MPFVKGNTIGSETRFTTGQSGNPAGRPPDKLRRFIYAELDKVERDATGKHEAVTKRRGPRRHPRAGIRRWRQDLDPAGSPPATARPAPRPDLIGMG